LAIRAFMSHRREGLDIEQQIRPVDQDEPGHDEQGGSVQLRGAEIGGGPRPIGFFGLSVPT
jgi:hypothetical protein